MVLRPIFYDTETTGIKASKDRVIELAAFDPENNKSFVQLINPGCHIPEEASSIHHITDDMVANEPCFKEIAQSFVHFCSGDTVLIAHNNDAFDILFLREEFSRAGIEMPEWNFFDTLKWSRRYRPDLPRHTLQFLREIYNIPANNAHRALDDVMILHKVFIAMVDDLDISTAIKLLNQERALSRMPFGKHQGKPLEKVPKSYVQWLAGSGAFDKPGNSELKTAFEKIGVL